VREWPRGERLQVQLAEHDRPAAKSKHIVLEAAEKRWAGTLRNVPELKPSLQELVEAFAGIAGAPVDDNRLQRRNAIRSVAAKLVQADAHGPQHIVEIPRIGHAHHAREGAVGRCLSGVGELHEQWKRLPGAPHIEPVIAGLDRSDESCGLCS
jgi:hypothetical protein